MEGGNHGDMRDHHDFNDLEQVPFMELLYGPPSVDNMEHHHNSLISSSWPPTASNYNYPHQNPSIHQFMSPMSIPSSYAPCGYAPLNRFASFPPPDQNQFSFEAKPNSSPIENFAVEKPADDGYNWRKYGQKQLKDGKYPKSYYKCTSPSCPVKKTIERSSEGHVTDITYQNRHNHGLVRQIDSRENEEIIVSQSDQERMSGSVDSDEMGNSEVIIDGADSEIDNNFKVGNCESSSSGSKRREPKIIFETRSEVDLIDDGYRWRKYGQKSVKGNAHPRSYYKCTHVQCNVRKQIERASRDPNIVLTTYEGKHTHDPAPSARAISSHDINQPNVSHFEASMVSERNNRLTNDAREHTMDLNPKEKVFFIT